MSSEARLTGKVAVITGASRGIGRATAIALARDGAQVVLTARNQAELESLAGEIHGLGGSALVVAADLTQAMEVERLRHKTMVTLGRVDILVNNAGVSKYGSLMELGIDDYDWMMNTNMRSTFLCTRLFLPHMLEQRDGYIIIVSSVAGLKGMARETVYCATKFAQVGFAQALDHEVREHGIKVSVIAPGGVNTYFALGTGRTPGDPNLENMMDAEDVAEAIVFAVTQPPKARIFMIGMRPMNEPL
ncbi:MAG: 3-ketoacyl-ACP reductase [Chloroflexota bacterium]|nr:MAG: 3-ketoacyl-ACP reductase [Chloroflexota bacterium]